MMCLRDSPRLFGFGPVGQKTLVKISIESRRTPAERLAEDALGLAHPVDVGRVERRHARVEGGAHAGDGLVLPDLPAVGDPVAVGDRRDHHAGAPEVPRVHGGGS